MVQINILALHNSKQELKNNHLLYYKKRVILQNKSNLLMKIFKYNTWTLQQI